MHKIITVTLNPCIDKSTTFSGLKPEKKLRCAKLKCEPGGGGINVSRAIQKLNGKSLAIYPAGGYTGHYFQELLEREKIESVVIETMDDLRENFIVVDDSTNNQYRFCMPGPVLQEKEWKQFLRKIESFDTDYIVLSGSLPPGVPEDLFGQIAAISKHKKTKVILDTSGTPLKHALEKGVYLWKPNLGELSSLSGYEEMTDENTLKAARDIIAKGMAEIIVISLGAAGAMLITREETARFATPLVVKKSTVGAGDSMVAGMVLSLSEGKALADAITYGVACGTAATMNPGTELCKASDVEQLYRSMSKNVELAVSP